MRIAALLSARPQAVLPDPIRPDTVISIFCVEATCFTHDSLLLGLDVDRGRLQGAMTEDSL